MRAIRTFIVLLIVVAGGAVAYAYSGLYDVAVGTGHNPVTEWYLETLRERSIEKRAAEVSVPDGLGDPAMVAAGAVHYDDGCAGCHGSPGKQPADVFEPQPPALARHAEDPAEAYWIIQNGIKMSAMPIKGRGHTQDEIWQMVAFLQELPSLDAEGYKAIVEKGQAEHEHDHGTADDGGSDSSTETAAPAAETAQSAIDAFHNALMTGDRGVALALLHESATILESGHLQTKAEYAAGHVDSDIEFLSGVTMQTASQDVDAGDTQATITTVTDISGEIDGESVDHRLRETATLVKTEAGWRISHLNWTPGDAGASNDASEE